MVYSAQRLLKVVVSVWTNFACLLYMLAWYRTKNPMSADRQDSFYVPRYGFILHGIYILLFAMPKRAAIRETVPKYTAIPRTGDGQLVRTSELFSFVEHSAEKSHLTDI